MLLQPYQPHWPVAFTEISTVLATVLKDLPLRIYHVGSTAVPGLVAKDIIDIDLEYPPEVALQDIQQRLAKLEYQHHGDQGIPQREVFKRKGRTEDHPVLDRIAHHLYACPQGSPELLRHLRFRDQLRGSPAYRNQYAQLKQDIAREAEQDKKTYATLKQEQARAFIESILEA